MLLFPACGINAGESKPLEKKPTGTIAAAPSHHRLMETRTYTGNSGAIIFSINHIEDKSLFNVTDRIIRLFSEREIPVDIGIYFASDGRDAEILNFLTPYVDAGLIDISFDGSDMSWLDADFPGGDTSITLNSQINGQISIIARTFGSAPAACILPYEQFNEHNYKILQDTGFIIVSSVEKGSFTSSRRPVAWSGQADNKGLYRLPIVVEVDYQSTGKLDEIAAEETVKTNKQYLIDIDKSIRGLGLAVVSIHPGYFVTSDGKADNGKLKQLSDLINQCGRDGEIVTFTGWKRYADNYIGIKQSQKRVLPAYSGGPTVIFRLDDVSKGWHEDIDKALIEIFKRNGVPLDCGVISNVSGANSYELPWLKKYHDEGAVGISVHGFDWTYYQLDTSKSGLTYEQIKFKLRKARDMYLNYYGVAPVAITVPTDFYDRDGYNACSDAGFKIFATQIAVEPHPSTVPVDFDGRKDPSGMYRLPTACDVSIWENERFADVYDVTKLAKVNDYCRYYQALSTTMTDDKFGYMVCSELGMLNVVVISLHPSAFVTDSGKIDQSRIDKVDAIVKWVKTFAAITTFEQWYNFHSTNK